MAGRRPIARRIRLRTSASWLKTTTFMGNDATDPGGRGTKAYAVS
jgi:hypothetical protein